MAIEEGKSLAVFQAVLPWLRLRGDVMRAGVFGRRSLGLACLELSPRHGYAAVPTDEAWVATSRL